MGALALVLRELPVLITVAIGVVVYGSLLLAFGVVGRDEFSVLRTLRSPKIRVADAAMLAG